MKQMLWKLAGDCALLSRAWDGEHVIYNPAAGDTHLLGEAAAQVLLRLLDGPADHMILSATVERFRHANVENNAASLPDHILDDLEALGMIERVSP